MGVNTSQDELIANAVTLATLLGLAAGAALRQAQDSAQTRRARQRAEIQPQTFLRHALRDGVFASLRQDTVFKTVQRNDLTAPKNGSTILNKGLRRLPAHLRRQRDKYIKRWTEAMFEPEEGPGVS